MGLKKSIYPNSRPLAASINRTCACRLHANAGGQS